MSRVYRYVPSKEFIGFDLKRPTGGFMIGLVLFFMVLAAVAPYGTMRALLGDRLRAHGTFVRLIAHGRLSLGRRTARFWQSAIANYPRNRLAQLHLIFKLLLPFPALFQF